MGSSSSSSKLQRELLVRAAKGDARGVNMLLRRNPDSFHHAKNNSSSLSSSSLSSSSSGHDQYDRHDKLDIDGRVDDGDFALEVACAHNSYEVVCVLLSLGANVNNRDSNGMTALMVAAHEGHVEIMQLLLSEPSIQINAADDEGETALHKAAMNGRSGALDLLIVRGADILTRDRDGNTALMVAVLNGHAACVERLIIEGGIDYAAISNDRAQKAAHLVQQSFLSRMLRVGRIRRLDVCTLLFDTLGLPYEAQEIVLRYDCDDTADRLNCTNNQDNCHRNANLTSNPGSNHEDEGEDQDLDSDDGYSSVALVSS